MDEKKGWKLLKMGLHNAKLIWALYLIAAPLFFVWINELVMDYNGTILTNGFRDIDGMQAYHIYMYLLFITNFVGAFVILKNECNYIRGKV